MVEGEAQGGKGSGSLNLRKLELKGWGTGWKAPRQRKKAE